MTESERERLESLDPNLDDLNLSSDDSMSFKDIDIGDLETLFPKKHDQIPLQTFASSHQVQPIQYLHSGSLEHCNNNINYDSTNRNNNGNATNAGKRLWNTPLPKDQEPLPIPSEAVYPVTSSYRPHHNSVNSLRDYCTTSSSQSMHHRTGSDSPELTTRASRPTHTRPSSRSDCSNFYAGDSEEEILKTLQRNVKQDKEDEQILENNSRFEPVGESDGQYTCNNFSAAVANPHHTQNHQSTSNLNRRANRLRHSRKRDSSTSINEMGEVTLTDVRSIKFTGFGKRILKEISYQNTKNLDYLYDNRETFSGANNMLLQAKTQGNGNGKRSKLSSKRASAASWDLPEVPKPVPVDIDADGDGTADDSDPLSRLDTFYTPDTDPTQLSDIELSKQLATFNLRRAKLIKSIETQEIDLVEMDRLTKMKQGELRHSVRALNLLGDKIIKYRQLEAERITRTSMRNSRSGYQHSHQQSSRDHSDSLESSSSTIESVTVDSGNVSEGQGTAEKADNPQGLEHFHELD